MLRVVLADAWPNLSWMSLMLVLASSRMETCRWCNLYGVLSGTSGHFAMMRCIHSGILDGSIGNIFSLLRQTVRQFSRIASVSGSMVIILFELSVFVSSPMT